MSPSDCLRAYRRIGPHERAAIVGMFARQCFRIAHADDFALRIMTENEGRECHRGADRLETARRHRDDQALDLTPENARQLERDGLDVPAGLESRTGRNGRKNRLDERVEIIAKDRRDDTRIRRLANGNRFSPPRARVPHDPGKPLVGSGCRARISSRFYAGVLRSRGGSGMGRRRIRKAMTGCQWLTEICQQVQRLP
jgi:hypothetical protein